MATQFTPEENGKLQTRLHNKRMNAQKRGIECNLDMEDMHMLGWKLLGNGLCDYTGLPFNTELVGQGGGNPRYPTLERIDDKKGYVRGNVCVVMRRANELKDNLVDKMTATSIIDQGDREIVQALMLNMSKDHMEKLKIKYIPQQENEMNTAEIMQGALNNVSVAVSKEHSVDSYVSADQDHCKHLRTERFGKEGAEVKETPVVEEKQSLPEDVAVALAYANYCKTFSDVGMKVSVTYAQFKAKYIRKVCAMTGEKLSVEPKAVLILDLNIGFAKDNFIIVSKKMETAMTNLMIQTGMSLPKVTAMLNKVA